MIIREWVRERVAGIGVFRDRMSMPIGKSPHLMEQSQCPFAESDPGRPLREGQCDVDRRLSARGPNVEGEGRS